MVNTQNLLGALVIIATVGTGILLLAAIPTVYAAAGTTTANVTTSVTITLPTSTVAFGNIPTGGTNGTAADDPAPFTVQNDGSTKVNVTVGASDLWTGTGGGNPSTNYQFATNTSGEGTCYDAGNSTTTLTNMPATGSPTLAIGYLNYTDSCDLAEVEIKITAPADEPAGSKSSTVTFTASQT